MTNLQPLGLAGQVAHLALSAKPGDKPDTSVSLFDQGLVQVLQAAVTGLMPAHAYVLALADNRDGTGTLQPLAAFMTNPAGSAVVNADGPIRQIVQSDVKVSQRYLVIAEGKPDRLGAVVQRQLPDSKTP